MRCGPGMTKPVVDFHGHMAVPAADELCAGTDGLAAEFAAEQRAHAPESLAANRAQLSRLRPKLTDVRTRLADRGRHGNAHVPLRAELEEPFDPGRGVVRALPFQTVRQEQRDAAALTPLLLGRGGVLVDDGLGLVREVA